MGVMLKISLVEDKVMQRSEVQPSQPRDPRPGPVGGGDVNFKVIYSVCSV